MADANGPGGQLSGFGQIRQQGIALVIVLWIVALLAVMAASATHTARTEVRLTTHTVERAQARALIDAGVAYAVNSLLIAPNPDDEWPIEGSERQWEFADGIVRFSVWDSVGKVDLNHANRELLGGLLRAQGLADDEVEALLDAIEDWRDPDDLKRLNGAELAEYEAAGRSVGPKDAPFESVDELLQVLGMNAELFLAIEDSLTVAGHKGINPEAASLQSLLAIPDVDPQAVRDYVAQRTEAIQEGYTPPPPPALGPYLSNAKGLAYHMVVEAELISGARTAVRVVVSQARRPGQAFHIISWQEG